uniref:Uncharacterized protein n=2 Tax=Heterorhabditis bacteriophora TaxID=37862 RepID=A0A1I7XMR1_HETBA
MAFFCGKYSRYKNHHNIYGVDARTIYHLQNPRNWLPKFVERAMNRIKAGFYPIPHSKETMEDFTKESPTFITPNYGHSRNPEFILKFDSPALMVRIKESLENELTLEMCKKWCSKNRDGCCRGSTRKITIQQN